MGPRYDEPGQRYRVRIQHRGEMLVDKAFYVAHYDSKEACQEAAERCWKATMALKKGQGVRQTTTYNATTGAQGVSRKLNTDGRISYAAQINDRKQHQFTIRQCEQVENPLLELKAFCAAKTARYLFEVCQDTGAEYDRTLVSDWRTYPGLLSPGMFRLRQFKMDGPVVLVRNDKDHEIKYDSYKVTILKPTTKAIPVSTISYSQQERHNLIADQIGDALAALDGGVK